MYLVVALFFHCFHASGSPLVPFVEANSEPRVEPSGDGATENLLGAATSEKDSVLVQVWQSLWFTGLLVTEALLKRGAGTTIPYTGMVLTQVTCLPAPSYFNCLPVDLHVAATRPEPLNSSPDITIPQSSDHSVLIGSGRQLSSPLTAMTCIQPT